MSFLGGLWGIAKNLLSSAAGSLIGEGVGALTKFIGSGSGQELTKTVGQTAGGALSNIGTIGVRKLDSVFGNTFGNYARQIGGALQQNVQSVACQDELQKIRDLEEEVYNLKRVKFGEI